MKSLSTFSVLLLFPFLFLKQSSLYTNFTKQIQGKQKKLLFAFASFFIFLNGFSYAETESNNDCTTATPILNSGDTSGSTTGTTNDTPDLDYYSFDVSSSGELNVTITSTSGKELEYSIVSETCPLSTTSNQLEPGEAISLIIPSTSETIYYVYIVGTSNATSDYNISATFIPNIPSSGTDLSITKRSSAETVLIYDPFYYIIDVSNIGTSNAGDVVITDSLPSGMSVNLPLTNTDSPDWNCTVVDSNATCELISGNLISGDISSLKLHVYAPSYDGNVTNEVSVTSNGVDVDPSNNTATDIVTLTAEVDTSEHLCYTDTTEITNTNYDTACEKVGNFYYGSGCDASVTVREVNATDKLSNVKVRKMYAPDLSSGTFTCSANTNGTPATPECTYITNLIDFGSYTEGYAVDINEVNVDNVNIEILDSNSDKNPRIDGIAMFGDYWTEDGFHHTGRIFDCNGTSEGGIEITSSADVIDTSIGTDATLAGHYNASTDTSNQGNNIKYIQTMIAADSTRNITGVHLNLDGDTVPYIYEGTESPAIPYSIIPFLADDSCSLNNENIIDPNTNQQVILDVPNNAYSGTNTMLVSDTVRDKVRMQMIYVNPNTLSVEGQQCLANSSTTGNFARLAQCVNSEVQYKTAFGQDAWDRCGNNHGLPCKSENNGFADTSDPSYDPLTDFIYTNELGCYMCTFNIGPVCSSDNFAIRPKAFDVNISNGDTFVSGKQTNLKFEAVNANDVTPTNDYNELEWDSFSVDINFTDATKSCQVDIQLQDDVQFIDGIDTDNFYFNDIGKDLNFTVAEINGSEYAIVDVNDTDDIDRLITPFVRNINVVPDEFIIEGNLTDHNSDHNFTYLHDINNHDSDDNYSMAATLTIDIKAVGADDSITRNYMETCYAEDTNLTLTLGSTNITYPGTAAPLTQFLYYNPAEDNGTADGGEGSYTLPAPVGNTISFTSLPIENIPSTFSDDTPDGNGTTHIEYKLNFDRKQHLAVNPFKMQLTDVNIIDTDGVDGTTGTLTNQEATLYYARSRPSKFFYEDISEPKASTPVAIDVYCSLDILGWTACTNLDIDTVNGQINERNWWLSTGHRETLGDGNITLVINLPGAIKEGATTDTPTVDTDVTVESQGQDNSIEVTSNATLLPMTVEIDLDVSNPTDTNHWLIYNPDSAIGSPSPFYKVRFIGTSGWVGVGETGYVLENNATNRKTKRLNW